MLKQRRFTDQFKAKVALEALRGDLTFQKIAAKHGLYPDQVSMFKWEAIDGLREVFAKTGKGKQGSPTAGSDQQVEKLNATIGKLTVENDFLSKGLDL